MNGALPASSLFYRAAVADRADVVRADVHQAGRGYNNYEDVTFTATQNAVSLTYPTAGQSNVTSALPFTWSTVASAQGYYLTVGTTKGALTW